MSIHRSVVGMGGEERCRVRGLGLMTGSCWQAWTTRPRAKDWNSRAASLPNSSKLFLLCLCVMLCGMVFPRLWWPEDGPVSQFFPSPGLWALGIEPRSSGLHGKPFTRWAFFWAPCVTSDWLQALALGLSNQWIHYCESPADQCTLSSPHSASSSRPR